MLSKAVCLTWIFFFFFQAEDGIRDLTVTGVQTCALPIARERWGRGAVGGEPVGRVGQVPEVMEGPLLERVEECGGLGRVWWRRALGVGGGARREDRRGEGGGGLRATRHAGGISLRCPGAGHRRGSPVARGGGA